MATMRTLTASSTGDLSNNVDKLRHELQHSKYVGPVDARAWRKGNPSDLLPLIHFSLLSYSRTVHDSLVAKGYDLFAKSDMRFLEVVYKLLRTEFGYQPQLRVEQFFAEGFVERKIILVHDVLKLCQRCHADLQRKLKATQRDNAGARSYAVHSGSGLSSLASSTSQKAARPLVEKGPPAGGKNVGQIASRNSVRGSGGLMGPEPRQTPDCEGMYAEDEDLEGLQPRAMRPPAPHPSITATGTHIMPPAGAVDQRIAWQCAHGSGAADVHQQGAHGAYRADHSGGAVPGHVTTWGPPTLHKVASMDWSDSQEADYSTQARDLQRPEGEQGLKAALNFTAHVHTSVSPKALGHPGSQHQETWNLPRDGSHSWFPVDGTLKDARQRLYRIDSDVDAESQESGFAPLARPPYQLQEIKTKIDELGLRLERMEGHIVTAVGLDARVSKLEEEYNARLLLSEGRIRFLEKRIAVMEDEQRAGTRSNSRGAAPLPNARKTPGEAGRAFGAGGGVAARGGEMVADSGVTNECGDVEGGSYTAGGGGRIPAADTANHLGSASTAGAGAAHLSLTPLPAYHAALAAHTLDTGAYPPQQSSSYPGASGGLTDISDEKLNLFISSIRERFRETHELLQAGKSQAAGGAVGTE